MDPTEQERQAAEEWNRARQVSSCCRDMVLIIIGFVLAVVFIVVLLALNP